MLNWGPLRRDDARASAKFRKTQSQMPPRYSGSAKRPIILAGGGALWSGAASAVETLAAQLGAPVVTTLNGKGLLDELHPRSLGHARSARARCVLPHADVMLAVGCRFTEVMTDWRRMTVPADLIQIDLEPTQIGMNFPVRSRHRRRRQGCGRGTLCGASGSAAAERLGYALRRGPWRQAEPARVDHRHAEERAARGCAGVYRRLRDRLSHAHRLDCKRAPAILLSVELHHLGLGLSGGSRCRSRAWRQSGGFCQR